MKMIPMLVAALCATSMVQAAERLTLNGAGASFPAPVYHQWTFAYTEANLGAAVNYQSIGSGAGINQIKASTVDFAGTDAPLTEEQCKEAGLTQFPMIRGAVVPIFNIPGVKDGQLRLTAEVLSAIFRGEITNWADERITSLNPGVRLPKINITVVHRADSSGTSNIFTTYLTEKDAKWKEQVGAGASVAWPTGMGGQKNPGVCNTVFRVRGVIGYTELTYAREGKLNVALLATDSGEYPVPENGKWPLVGTTYILVRNDAAPEKRAALNAFFTWCFTQGNEAAEKLCYLPLDEADQQKIIDSCLK